MFHPLKINTALDHLANSHKGEFTDEEVLMLCQYWTHLLDITVGVNGLQVISSYAAHQLHSITSVLNARGLPNPPSYEAEVVMNFKQ